MGSIHQDKDPVVCRQGQLVDIGEQPQVTVVEFCGLVRILVEVKVIDFRGFFDLFINITIKLELV